MAKQDELTRYLPLTESTYYTLLVLMDPLHGYGIMQKVEQASEGQVIIGPGTLYGALTTLEKEKLIQKIEEQDRRKIYQITPKGKSVLRLQIERLQVMVNNGQGVYPWL